MPPTLDRLRRRVPLRSLAIAAALAVAAINLAVPGAPSALPGGPATDEQIDAWLAHQIADAGIPGAALVVVRDGRIVHERGFGTADDTGRAVTAHTPFVIGSLTKSFTALAVMQLVGAGRVDLDRPVVDYVAPFRIAGDDAGAAITVRELLDQTSGLSTAAGIAPLSTPVSSLDARVRDLATVAPVSAPGAAFHYSNANYVVLGRLIEQVSGLDYGTYLGTHVFEPLGMATATTAHASAVRWGLASAHRLFFGIPDSHEAPARPDLVSAGFVVASADDLGRFLLAQLGHAPGREPVVSPDGLAAMHDGVAPTGIADQRYGMGWFDGSLDGVRVVSHTGSTTDMAAFQALVPDEGLGVAVLFDATSPVYELLHKPDAIGLGVVSMLLGKAPGGTIELLYPAIDIALLVALVLQLRSLVGLARSPHAAPTGWRARPVARWGLVALRGYLDVVVPVAILVVIPGWLAPWPSLIRTDIGVVLAAIVVLRVADGSLRLRRLRRRRLDEARETRPGTLLTTSAAR